MGNYMSAGELQFVFTLVSYLNNFPVNADVSVEAAITDANGDRLGVVGYTAGGEYGFVYDN